MRNISANILVFTVPLFFACTKDPEDPSVTPVVSCKTEGEVGCVARADFPAVDKAALATKAAGLKAGVTLLGTAGALPVCAADNGVACLTTAEFPSVVKADLSAGNLANGTTVAGTAGTFAPPCMMDAQPSCLTTATFKAVNFAALTSWDLRLGKTFAGIAGTSTFYRNASTLAEFNEATVTGSSNSAVAADVYDSIDDEANGTGVPSLLPAGAPTIQSNWIREATSDTDADQTCNGMEACVYTDLFTGLHWHEDNGMSYLWSAAVSNCEGLTVGTKTAWRLPTQKELMQAYINRIWTLEATLNLDAGNEYYTTTAVTVSGLTTLAWAVQLSLGNVTTQDKGADSNRIICVHQ